MSRWRLQEYKVTDASDGGCIIKFTVIETAGVIRDGKADLLKSENKKLKAFIEWGDRTEEYEAWLKGLFE